MDFYLGGGAKAIYMDIGLPRLSILMKYKINSCSQTKQQTLAESEE